ncbi:glycosyltransferase [Marinigracilibium pacificum]|uniref:Glycosyltransferase family 4 protein n=1 Tax=Marinigracilibium pacificum TaxID=2729599 RepID=A0A848J728_9BACT|nr:glycosyltransferase [Marinigracilibium pacificum]NMM50310.1 glycosyltransferase family 4 protein [Marinigracilibium pacificum]
MKILITGNYHPDNERTRDLICGLKQIGAKIIPLPYKSLKLDTAKKISEISKTVDAVFLPGFTHNNVKQIKKISNAPVLFNPEISRYLSKVYDEKETIKFTPGAINSFYKDYRALKYADRVFTETKQYKHYFMNKMGVKAQKIIVMPPAVDTSKYHPIKNIAPDEFFRIVTIIENATLDSIEVIINAANLLHGQNFKFDLLGSHPEQVKILKLISSKNLKNVNMMNYETDEELNKFINYSSACIGIFGDSKRSNMGVPKEILKYAACGKPIISKNSMAIKEVFTPGKDIIAIENSAEKIASMIRELKNDPEMGLMLGKMAVKTIETKFQSKNSASILLKTIKRIKEKRL